MQAATIEVRKSRGHIIVQATGRTGKGQKYIKGTIPLKVTSITDKKFKGEMQTAVEELIGRED